MITTEFIHREWEAARGPTRSTAVQAFEQTLRRVFESRERAVRLVRSAAGARRDLPFALPQRFAALSVDLVGTSGVGGEFLSSLSALELAVKSSDAREAQWCALLDAAVDNLVRSNEALTDMATTVVRQLVGEPGKLMSGSEIAEMLGVTEEAVRLRHKDGKLIAVLSAGRERGRGFPIFQAWDGVAGEPLEKVLKAFGYEGPGKSVDAAQAFQFFIARDDMLGGFTPVEVLTGAGVIDPDDAEAAEFLSKPPAERVDFVEDFARGFAKARGK